MNSELRKALRAKSRATAVYLFADPNVRLIDVGWRVKERDNKHITDELTVRVHLRNKLRGEAFEAFSATQPTRVISEDRVGFPVDIIEADYPLQWYWPQRSSHALLYDPLCGGISISKLWQYSFGTLGGLVVDRQTGEPMILSNWHVLAGSAYTPKGLKFCQPAYADGGRYEHTVAVIERHAMNEGIDAAVAKLTGSRKWSNEQLDIGAVVGSAVPALDMHIIKSGRASEVTEGIITGIEGVRKIMYGGYERMVKHIAHIVLAPGQKQVSTGGDSGSWWLNKVTNEVIGLHFAGSDEPEYGLAIAMPNVLDALNVDVLTAVTPKTKTPPQSTNVSDWRMLYATPGF